MQALKNTVWNLLIVILCGVLAFLLYKRGKLDNYLPEKYVSTTFLLPGPIFSFNIAPTTEPEGAAATVPATANAAPPVGVVGKTEANEPTAPARPAPPTVSQAATRSIAPAPAPKAEAQPVALSTLAPHHLPREVKLLRATAFPVIFNGRAAGSFSAPAGLSVKVLRINHDKLLVQSGEAQKEIPATDTDIYQRVKALMNR